MNFSLKEHKKKKIEILIFGPVSTNFQFFFSLSLLFIIMSSTVVN